MTTHIDQTRIEREVTDYYRYATFSPTWEDNEPSFEKVVHVVVYNLEEYPTHEKLRMFCNIVRGAGFNWAWSDTCCINKTDHVVLQEALVAMFKWYEGSAMTIIYLRGVRSPSRPGDLVKSIWNTRGWTFQEYHASKVVRFYTEDWTPYLNLDIFNHKESPEIIAEMEQATGVPARALMALRPGSNDIREKLCLASRRETTFVEDAAYSLLGIFSMTLPVVYGEGDRAVGRLLQQLLASSGDTSILAWTGKSGSLNSCLPASTAVFEEFPPAHVPPFIEAAKMEVITTRIRSSSFNASSATRLYDRLHELPVPSFSEKRMKLPCLIFKLGQVSETSSTSGRVFRARADALGVVEITTNEDLSQLDSLTLVHPWIDFLLDRRPIGDFTEILSQEFRYHSASPISYSPSSSSASSTAPAVHRRRPTFFDRFRYFSAQRLDALFPPPSPESPGDKRTQAIRLVARLRQQFGALLFTPTRRNMAEYRRVAAESMITVRIQENTSLETLIDSVRVLDVL